MLSSRRIFAVVVIAATVVLGLLAYTTVGPTAAAKPIATTATVERGTVLSSVTATGNVSAATQLSLNFSSSGTVTEIDVAPGQHVSAGQVLAKIDDTSAQASLRGAQQTLASTQAKAVADLQVVTPQVRAQDQIAAEQAQQAVNVANQGVANAQASAAQDAVQQTAAVAQAQQSLANTQANAQQDAALQQAAVSQAEAKLATDQSTAAVQLGADQVQLAADQQKGSTDNQALAAAEAQYTTDKCGTSDAAPTCTADQTAITTAAQAVAADQVKVASDQVKITQDGNTVTQDQTTVTNTENAQTSAVLKDQQSLQSAQNTVANAQTNLQGSQLKDQQAIQSAQNQLMSAQLSQRSTLLANATKEAPATAVTITGDQSSITSAQNQLATAQANLQATVLTAPVAGTVAAVNGQVGTSSTSGSSTSSSSSSSSSSSATAGFMTLTNLASLQVVAGYSETDAAKIQAGQPATVTFSALPNETVAGKVSVVSVNSQVVSNVVTYNITVSITNPPSTLKPGMTANVAIVTAERDNVLTLPSSAVTSTGSSATVDVEQANGTVIAHPITIGMRGDTLLEITSGLNVGDKVVVTRSSSTSMGGTSGGGGTRVGGAGFGLGGLG